MKFGREEIAAAKPVADFLKTLSHNHFVLHGSQTRFSKAEPRQARGTPGKDHQNLLAIYASVIPEYAIVHALINREREDIRYGLDSDHELLVVQGKHIHLTPGFVYVLPRAEFTTLDDGFDLAWLIARKSVMPIAIVEVMPSVLPHFPEIGFKCDTLSKGE